MSKYWHECGFCYACGSICELCFLYENEIKGILICQSNGNGSTSYAIEAIIYAVNHEFNDALEEDNLHTAESRQALVDMDVAFPTFDNMILFVLVVLSIGLIITSFFIPTHPIFMVVNVFGIFFLVFLGMVLSNLYADIIAESPELASVYGTFPKLNFIMNQLPWIAVILVFLCTIIQYSKFRSGEG